MRWGWYFDRSWFLQVCQRPQSCIVSLSPSSMFSMMSVVYVEAQLQVQCNQSIFFFQLSCLAWLTLNIQSDSGGWDIFPRGRSAWTSWPQSCLVSSVPSREARWRWNRSASSMSVVLGEAWLQVQCAKPGYQGSTQNATNLSLTQSIFYVFGSIIGKNNSGLRSKYFSSEILWLNICIFSLFVGLMYNSVIISVLTSGSKEQFIDSLEKLAKHKDTKIYLKRGSFSYAVVKSTKYFHELKPRIIDRNPKDLTVMFKNSHSGTHAVISFEQSIKRVYKNHMSKSFLCQYPYEDIAQSRTLSGTYLGYIFKKTFRLAGQINKRIMQMSQSGILGHRGSRRTKLPLHMKNREKEGLFYAGNFNRKCPKPPQGMKLLWNCCLMGNYNIDISEDLTVHESFCTGMSRASAKNDKALTLLHYERLFIFWANCLSIGLLTFFVELLSQAMN